MIYTFKENQEQRLNLKVDRQPIYAAGFMRKSRQNWQKLRNFARVTTLNDPISIILGENWISMLC